ncbi:MAG: ABC transporter substrate-binding protein [Ruminococcaceae bacterium]|nr:ABC transporter substrate-binding protein [Oscillospiraceae bacterium]
MKKRTISTTLMICMLILASCQNTDKPADTSDAAADSPVDSTAQDIYADLPQGNFGGAEVVFANELESSSWAILMLDSETITGDVLDDAVYLRNRTVEERLGITIQVEEYKSGNELCKSVISNVMAGDDPYDVYDIPANLSAPLILEDYFVEVDTLGLDISKPWWNDTVMNSLTFNNACYSIAGDLSIMLWEASYGLIYNKDMASKLNLPDQYQLVRDGKFTLDSVHAAMKLAYQDNGNTVVDTEDTFGMTGNLRLMTYSMLAGGETLFSSDHERLPEFTGLTNRMAEMYDKIFDVYFANDSVFLANRMKFTDGSKNWHTLFTDGKALFYFEPIGANVKLRNADFDFGFLPMPKYDEAQENYITPILQFAHTMHVTKANDRIDMVGTVLENLAAESHKNVRSIYFEKVIEGKRAQDDGTLEMFEIIFDNQVMNSMTVYDWGGLAGKLNDSALAGTREIASAIASLTTKIQSDMQKTADYYGK